MYNCDKDKLIYCYKSGKIKAEEPFINNMMEGEWRLYRENGKLWQVANFKNNIKHEIWVRYDKRRNEEYREIFETNKEKRKKKKEIF